MPSRSERSLGEPMDLAWQLLKAPLDFESVRDVGVVEEGGFPYRRFEADFIDPETQERLPAFARLSDDGVGVGRIQDPDPESLLRNRAFHMIHPYGDKGVYPYSIGTDKNFRGRGYQEALLNLIMRLAEAEGKTFYEPPQSSKTGDGNMFAQRMREKYGDKDVEVITGEPMDLAWQLLKMPVFFEEEAPWLEQQLYQAGQTQTPPDPATKPPPRDMRSDMGNVRIVGRGDLPTKKPEIFAEGPKETHSGDWDVWNWFNRFGDDEMRFQSNDDKVRATFGKPDAHGVVRVPKFAVRDDSRGQGHGRAGWEELLAEIKALYGDHVTVKPIDILRESQGFWDKVGAKGSPYRPRRETYPYGRIWNKGERTSIDRTQKI